MRNVFGIVVLVLVLVGVRAGAAETVEVEAKGAKQGGSESKPEETLTLKVGEKRPLSFPGVTRVAVGDPGVADIQVEGAGAVRVQARKVGETMLLVWTPEGRKAYRIVVQG